MSDETTTLHVRKIEADTSEDLPDKDEGQFTDGDSPEDIAHDNYRRATFASVGVKAFAEATGLVDEDPRTAIVDLIADLHHLADCLDLSFEALCDSAEMHYDPETTGQL